MAAFDQVRDKWESITPRERRMVLLLGVSFVLIMIIYVSLQIRDGMNAIDTRNQRARTALQRLTQFKASAQTAASPDAPVIPDEAVKLESYLFGAAAAAKVTIPGVNARPPVAKGKFITHSATVEVREVSLTDIKNFLEAVEGQSRVVQVSSMQLRRNFRDKEKLDLNVEVVTWSNNKTAEPEGSGKGTGKGTGTAKAGG
jgi:Tfp pilus assembly protein PilO